MVFGSATPSVESYHLALRDEYRLVEMPHRVNQRAFPEIALVDMRTEFAGGNRTMFSELLTQELNKTLARGNRRSFSSTAAVMHPLCSAESAGMW